MRCYRADFETRANANALRRAVALPRLKVTRSLPRDTAELLYVQTDESVARGDRRRSRKGVGAYPTQCGAGKELNSFEIAGAASARVVRLGVCAAGRVPPV